MAKKRPASLRGKALSGKKPNKQPSVPSSVAAVAKAPRRNSRPNSKEPAGCPIVGIGASAGGFEAVREILRTLPNNTGMAFVFIQHLDPKHESMLTELLARETNMPVHEATEGMPVAPNQMY